MFNRKSVALVAITLLATGLSLKAGASDSVNFYVGAEVSVLNKTVYTNADTADIRKFKTHNTDTKLAIKQSKPGVGALIGGRFNENFGAELGFSLIQTVKGAGQPGQSTNKVSNIYVDVLAYMPLTSQLNIVISAGIGALKSKASVVGASFQNLADLNKRKISYRAGGGAQYDFTNNWAARGMLRYQKGNKVFLKSNVSLSIGAVYTF